MDKNVMTDALKITQKWESYLRIGVCCAFAMGRRSPHLCVFQVEITMLGLSFGFRSNISFPHNVSFITLYSIIFDFLYMK